MIIFKKQKNDRIKAVLQGSLKVFEQEEKVNKKAGIVDLFPISKAISFTFDCKRKGLIDEKYKIINSLFGEVQ